MPLFSGKRVALFLAMLAFILWVNIKANSWKDIALTTILLFISLAFAVNLGEKLLEFNIRTIDKLTLLAAGDTSGRVDLIYEQLGVLISLDHIGFYLFGLGYDSMGQYLGRASHNDIFDVISSYGLFGFTIFSLLIFYIIHLIYKFDSKHPLKKVGYMYLGVLVVSTISFRWYGMSGAYLNFFVLALLLHDTWGNALEKK